MKPSPGSSRLTISTWFPSGESGQVDIDLEELGARVFELRSRWFSLLPTSVYRGHGMDQVIRPDGAWVVVTPEIRQEHTRVALASLLQHRGCVGVIPFQWNGEGGHLPSALETLGELLARTEPHPYYVLLVGPACELPFVVGQYLRHRSHLVGRLGVTGERELRAYAEKVIRVEGQDRLSAEGPHAGVFVLPTFDPNTSIHRDRVLMPMVEVMKAGKVPVEVFSALEEVEVQGTPGPRVVVVCGHGTPPGVTGRELGTVYVGSRLPLTAPRLLQHIDIQGSILFLHACCSAGASPNDLLSTTSGLGAEQDSRPTYDLLNHPAGPLVVVGHVDTLIHLESESRSRVPPDVWPLLHGVACLLYHRPAGLVGHIFQHMSWEVELQLLALLRTPPRDVDAREKLAQIWLQWRGLAGWEVLGDPRVVVGGGSGAMTLRDGFDGLGYLANTPAEYRQGVRNAWLR